MIIVLGALLIGLTLGLLGSGGSILTVPILVYLLGHHDKTAIAESLAIVGAISLAGMIPYARRHDVDWRSVWLFGLPGMGGTYLGAWLANYVSGTIQLLLFAVVMLVAAFMMFRRPTRRDEAPHLETPRHESWKIALEGLAVGGLTGLVGVGGGFLIVPALVVLGGLTMRLAVGTSLVVIALKSFSGFFKYLGVLGSMGQSVDWGTIALFIAIGIVGSYVGSRVHERIPQATLQRGFAAFLIVMGAFILGREAPRLLSPIEAGRQQTPAFAEPATEFTLQPTANNRKDPNRCC